jgi:hypothetical protein
MSLNLIKSQSLWLAVFVGVAVLIGAPSGRAAAVTSPEVTPKWTPADESLCLRAQVNAGDWGRLHRQFAKAREGGNIVVGVIGGSITQGASASKTEKRYGNLVADWWREKFPNAKVKFVNAGIGATGTDYGSLRVQRDLLSQRPDFVVVEYAVNDGNTRDAAETLEGLLRQVLKQPNQPAVLLLFMMNQHGNNAQEWFAKVG